SEFPQLLDTNVEHVHGRVEEVRASQQPHEVHHPGIALAMMLSLVTKRDSQILRTCQQRDGNHDETPAEPPERERYARLGAREDPQCSAASNEVSLGEERARGASTDEEERQSDRESACANRQSALGDQVQPQLGSRRGQGEHGTGYACRSAAEGVSRRG